MFLENYRRNKMANKQQILEILTILTAAYPRTEITEPTVRLYQEALADIPDDVLRASALDHISRSTFFQAVAELRSSAADIALDTRRFPTAFDAWQQAFRAMVDYGRDRKPDFDNPILEKTLFALGWRNLCMSTNQVADRARFIECYNIFLKRAKDDAVTLPQVKDLAARLCGRLQPAALIAPEYSYPNTQGSDDTDD
jgi:tetratricopeptide (TPR) repeat protein